MIVWRARRGQLQLLRLGRRPLSAVPALSHRGHRRRHQRLTVCSCRRVRSYSGECKKQSCVCRNLQVEVKRTVHQYARTSDQAGQTQPLISVWTYGRLEVQFEMLKRRPPFDDETLRLLQ